MTRNEIEQLIMNHSKSINAMSIKMTMTSPVEADDLFQNTCIRLIIKHEKYVQRQKSHFLNFVKVVMMRSHLHMIRSHKTRASKSKSYTQYKSIASRSYNISDANLLYESITELLSSDYEIDIVNMLIDGFLFREIADKYQVPKETIHGRHRRVRKRLRKALL